MISVIISFLVDNFIFLCLEVGVGILYFSTANIKYSIRRRIGIMWVSTMLLGVLAFLEQYIRTNQLGMHTFVVTLFVVVSVLKPMVLLLFIDVLQGHNKLSIFNQCLLVINMLIYLTAYFSDVAFWIDDQGRFHRGIVGYASVILSIYYALIALMVTVKYFKNRNPKANAVMFFCFLTAIFSTIADVVSMSGKNSIECLLLCSIFYYIYVYTQYIEVNMDKTKQALRTTQIKPHFVYNTLTAIAYLCKKDPDKAADTVDKFSTYLRNVVDSSSSETELVSFERELEHTKIFSDIEMLRFSNVKVDYDIDDSDFELPFLTIQPMVENAIVHGARNKKDGRVLVKTYRDGAEHVVEIIDNGVGMDYNPNIMPNDRSHIGVNNVCKRIEFICAGSFDIDSKPGEGTRVVIRIPDRKAKRG